MKKIITICFLIVCFVSSSGAAFGAYDLIIDGIQEYNTPVSYSGKTILVADSAYLIYDCNFTLENCTIDVNGAVELNSDVNLVNSKIITKGNVKVKPGIKITETGASSIIVTGDSQHMGQVNIEGELFKRITVISDYVQGSDAEFIILDANSSSDSSVKYVDFYGGWTNIQIYNKRLSSAIEGCLFYGGKYAIYQEGSDQLTDIRFSLFYQNYLSINLEMDGNYRENVIYSLDNIVIDNNDLNNSFGIVLSGWQNPSYLTNFKLTNSIITNCYCGWYVDVEEYFYPPAIFNVAYYVNTYNDNLYDSSFQINPMYLTQTPFETPEDPNGWPYFIKPDSPVADVNLGYDIWQNAPEQTLTSLFKYPAPRANKGMGFGIPLPPGYFSSMYKIDGDFDENGMINFCDFSVFALEWLSERGVVNYSAADFDYSGKVGILDLKILADNWMSLSADFNHGDISGDNKVNFIDYSIFAGEWQTIGPNSVHFPDVNGYSLADFDHSGMVDTVDLALLTNNWLSTSGVGLVIEDNENALVVTCQGLEDANTAYYAFFIDGKLVGSADSEENPFLTIDKMRFSNGTHYLRAAIKTADDKVYLTAEQPASFNSSLHDLTFQEVFDPAKNFTIKGKLEPGNSATIQIKSMDDAVLWSGDYTSDFMIVVNANVFSSGAVNYTLSYNYAPNGGLFAQTSLLVKSLSSSSSASGAASLLALGGPPSYEKAGLIICMMSDGWKDGANYTDTGTCRYAYKQWQGRAKQIVLFGEYNQVRHDMLSRVFDKYKNIQVGHFYAHGNYLVGYYGFRHRRTALLFNDGVWLAHNSRKWTLKGQPVPDGYEWLPDYLENSHLFTELPFAAGQLRILVLESCYNLRNVATMDGQGVVTYHNWVYDYEIDNYLNSHYAYPYSDICFGLNTLNNNQMVLGGGDVVIKGSLYPYYSRFFNVFWLHVCEGDNAYQAMQEAMGVASMEVLRKFRWRGAGNIYSIHF